LENVNLDYIIRILQNLANIDAIYQFGGNNIKGSNIFFSNFKEDPWHHCGVLTDKGNDMVAEYHGNFINFF